MNHPSWQIHTASPLSTSPWSVRREAIITLASRFSLDANSLCDEIDDRLDLWLEQGATQ